MKQSNNFPLIKIHEYYLASIEKWVPFEVMRMRYEEAFSDLTEEEVLSFRKYQARWFYKEKTDKNQIGAHESENEASIHAEYIALLEEKTKILVLKKTKEKVKLSSIEILQQLRERNVAIKNTHRLYFSMKEKKEKGEFAYLLLDENGEVVQKDHIKETILPRNKENYIFQVLLYLLKKAQGLDIKQLILHTHHHDNKTILTKINKGQTSKKIRIIKNQYSDLCQLFEQFEYLQYEHINKAKNKEAIAFLKSQRQHTFDGKVLYHAHVDVSVDYVKQQSYIAGVLKNIYGIKKLTYTKKVSYSENTARLEIMAIIEMMKQANKKGCTPVVIHTDNKLAYDYFHTLIPKKGKNNAMYKLIEKAKNAYHDCVVQMIHRDDNQEAHQLARNYKKAL